MELCSMLYGNLDGRWVWGRMDARIYMAKYLHCSPVNTTTLLTVYTAIQNKKFFLKNSRVSALQGPRQPSTGLESPCQHSAGPRKCLFSPWCYVILLCTCFLLCGTSQQFLIHLGVSSVLKGSFVSWIFCVLQRGLMLKKASCKKHIPWILMYASSPALQACLKTVSQKAGDISQEHDLSWGKLKQVQESSQHHLFNTLRGNNK